MVAYVTGVGKGAEAVRALVDEQAALNQLQLNSPAGALTSTEARRLDMLNNFTNGLNEQSDAYVKASEQVEMAKKVGESFTAAQRDQTGVVDKATAALNARAEALGVSTKLTEEQIKALEDWHKATRQAYQSFIDLGGAYGERLSL
jgi:selenocysteine lyase/cysteine desulfurase